MDDVESHDRSLQKRSPSHAMDYERMLKELPELKKTLDFRYGAISVRLPRSWNPVKLLYEFFMDMHI